MHSECSSKKVWSRIGTKYKYIIICFIIWWVIPMMYFAIKPEVAFLHDAYDYWTTGDFMWKQNGKYISLESFPNTFRGYFIYFIITIFKHAAGYIGGNQYIGWCVFITFMLSVTFVLALPILFDTDKFGKKHILSNLMLVYLVIFFWGDTLRYPASDWPSSLFIICGAAMLKSTMKKNSFIRAAIAGAFLYASYNTRSVFLYSVAGILALWVYFIIKKYKMKCVIILLGLLSGVAIIATPQAIINKKNIDSYSIKVNVNQYANNYSIDLKKLLLHDGVRFLRYETYDGSLDIYEENGVRFYDWVGQEILQNEGIEKGQFGYSTIFRLVYKYPGSMMAIYTKHIISAFTPIWGEVYIYDLYSSKLLRVTLNFVIWFIVVSSILMYRKNAIFQKSKAVNIFVFILLMLPGFLQIIGTVEIRYFITTYILGYFYLLFGIDYNEYIDKVKKNWINLAVIGIVVYLLWITAVQDILANNEYRHFYIDGNNIQNISTGNESDAD